MNFHQDIFLHPPPSFPHSMNIIQYSIITFRVVCIEPPAICQLQFIFPHSGMVLVVVSAFRFCPFKLWFSVVTYLSSLGRKWFVLDLTSLTAWRRVDFSVCLAFYLLWWSGDTGQGIRRLDILILGANETPKWSCPVYQRMLIWLR